MKNIPNIKLNNNLEIPIIGLGTWHLNEEECARVVKKALEIGYTHIDTAEIYLNESAISEAIKNFPREKLFITSKAWTDNLDYYRVIDACKESLAKLGTIYLDNYLLHWPNKNMNYENIFKAFKKLYDEGKIKSFGVSNCTIHHLKDLLPICKKLRLPLTVNQVEFHPYLYQNELLYFCNKYNIKIVAYSPLAQGKITDNKKLQDIGKKYDKTTTQISLRRIMQKNIIAIPKASSEKHLKENMNIFNFELSNDDIKEIDGLGNNLRIINPSFAEFEY